MKKFSIRDGARVSGVSADVLADELGRLHDRNDGLLATDVLDSARPKDSPLHPAFEWDDGVAAEAYRLNQARHIIRAVVITEQREDGELVKARVFAWTPPQRGNEEEDSEDTSNAGKYRMVSAIIQQPDQFALALAALNRKLQEALTSVRELENAAKRAPQAGDRLERISTAVRALETAAQAVAFH